MIRQKMVWSLAIAATVMVLMAAVPARADIVTSDLLLSLDAANADGAGNPGSGSQTTWTNLSGTATNYDATLAAIGTGSLPAWAGTGTVADPYRAQFRRVDQFDGGYATVANSSGTASALNQTVFTYEVWARLAGAGDTSSDALNILISHSSLDATQGTGGIYWLPATDTLATCGGSAVNVEFPNSVGDFSQAGYHQFVFTRAGAGLTDSAYYLDGVLQGTFQSDSNQGASSLLAINARNYGGTANSFLNADVALVRVYGVALDSTQVTQNFQADGARFGLVPEPSSIVLLVSGLIGLLAYAWRKRK